MDATECGLSAVGDRLLLAQFARPRADRRTRLAVLGDPHVATRSRETYRVFHRTEQRLRTAIDDCNERDVDLVVFPGDLTKDGEPWNYDRVDVLLEELERPFVATPGNHDLQKRQDEHDCPSPSAFADRYASGSLPGRYEMDEIDLFVLNSASGPDGAYTDTHRGLVSSDQIEWLDEELEGTTAPIVCCHHNPMPIVNDPLCQSQPWRTFTMRRRERLRSVLEKHDVGLVLSGHHHLPAVVRHGETRQLIAPALASYPQAYCLLEIDEDGTSVWLVSVAGEAGRSEAYELAEAGPTFRRTLLGITEDALEDSPLLSEPPLIVGSPSVGAAKPVR
ncbi:metallophosphoesterase [Natrarchaeobius sp. A-rgal3]|uniref:metallophosphoesterase family protein n=1 Tax=Natrarchaeobius versutus TaxID=1679078 RepID=UPI00350EEA1F